MEENKIFDTISTEEQGINGAADEAVLPEDEDIAEESLLSDNAELSENEAEEQPEESSVVEEKPEYVPKNKYEKALYSVYRDQGFSEMLRIGSFAVVAITVYAFFVHLLKLLAHGYLAPLELLIITGVPFIALTVMRSIINAPRPYELLEFYEKKPKGKAGHSFPSRHVFSVFVIATVITPANIALGLVLAVLGAALAAMRVLLGLHFIRDVVAGALIGVIAGVVGLLTLLLI